MKHKVLKKIRADGKDYFPSSDPKNPTLVDASQWRWTKKLVDQGKLAPYYEECSCSHLGSDPRTSGGHDDADAKTAGTPVVEGKKPASEGSRPKFMVPKTGRNATTA